MAHKKGVGSTDNGRDSNAKRRGVKLFGGQLAIAGNIIVRQKGTKFHPGENVYMGRDFTLHAKVDGTVAFKRRRKNRMYVNIIPFDVVEETIATPARRKKKAAPAPAVEEAPVAVAAPAKAKKEKAPAKPKKDAPVKAEKKAKAPAKAKAEKATPAKVEKKEKAPAKPKAKAAAKIELPSGKKIKQDDLKMIEGVGPKIEGLLNEGGIITWADLANAPEKDVQAILDAAGPRYRMHSPKTWAKQAKLADKAKWQELEDLQDRLIGGREPEDIK